jgi:hypothetical protein
MGAHVCADTGRAAALGSSTHQPAGPDPCLPPRRGPGGPMEPAEPARDCRWRAAIAGGPGRARPASGRRPSGRCAGCALGGVLGGYGGTCAADTRGRVQRIRGDVCSRYEGTCAADTRGRVQRIRGDVCSRYEGTCAADTGDVCSGYEGTCAADTGGRVQRIRGDVCSGYEGTCAADTRGRVQRIRGDVCSACARTSLRGACGAAYSCLSAWARPAGPRVTSAAGRAGG